MYRVLLVDDEIFARKGLRKLIDWAACGYEVVEEADNGEDALALIRELQPDVVVTDIRMPVLDGLGLIRHIVEREKIRTQFIIISGYDDFAYAQQAVRFGVHDFILKPVDQDLLQTTLKKLHHKLAREKVLASEREQLERHEIFASLIKGEASELLLPVWAKRLHMKPDEEVRYVFAELNDIYPLELAEADKLTVKLKETLKQELRALTGRPDTFVYKHRNRLGFVMPVGASLSGFGKFDLFAAELQRRLAKSFRHPVYVYAGKPARSLAHMSQSYQSAKEALYYKFIVQNDRLIIHDNVADIQLHFAELDAKLHQQMTEYVELHDESAFTSCIDDIFQQFHTRQFASEAVKLAIHRCVSSIIQIMNRMSINERELSSLEPIISWQDHNISPQELKRLFANFLSGSSGLLSARRKESVKGGIQRIKSYIEQNYADNISLKSIAAIFYMNPVYLGQLFKKTYGLYFNEFLLNLRINEAKKLLRQTDLRIYEVAERVGFNNADYFVTQFEKLEQMTPTEYRNMLL